MAAEPLELVLAGRLTNLVQTLDRASKGLLRVAETVAKVRTTVEANADAIERALGSLPSAVRQADGAFDTLAASAGKAGDALTETANDAEKAADRITRSAQKAAAGTQRLGDASATAGDGVTRAFQSIERSVSGGVQRVQQAVFNVRNALLGLGAIQVGRQVVDTASEFQSALGQLAIVADDTGVPIDEFRRRLLALAEGTPLELVDLTKSLGTAIGSLPKGANQAAVAFEALDAAQKAARASGATTEEKLKGITGILNTYGATGITAQQVSDKLFATFDQGAATVPELTASIGQVAGIAAQFNIDINELFGTIAVLTRGGQSASEAVTNVRQALISISRPPEVVKKKLAELNVEFGAAALRSKGLVGVLEEVQKAGGEPILNELLTDTQGFLGAAGLFKAGLGQVRDDIERIGNSSGKTDAALEKIKGQFDQTAGILKNRLSATAVEIGERVLPNLQKVLEDIGGFLVQNREAIAEGFSDLFDTLVGLGRFVAENGRAILLFFGGFKLGSVLGDAVVGLDKLKAKIVDIAAAAAGGEAVGGKFVGGFGKALGRLGPIIAGLLKSPTVLGLAVAAALALGQVIGDAIGRSMSEEFEKQAAATLKRIDDLDAQLREKLRKRGFKTKEELDDLQAKLNSGEAINVSGRARDFGPGDVLTPAQAVATLGPEAANLEFSKAVADLQKKADTIKAEAASLGQSYVSVQQLVASGNAAVDQSLLPKLTSDLDAAGKRYTAAVEALERLKVSTAQALKDANAPKAQPTTRSTGGGSTGKDAARAAEEEARKAKQRLEEIDRTRRALDEQAAADARKAREADLAEREAAFDAETERLTALAEARAATDEEIADLQRERYDARRSLIDDEIALVYQAANEEVAAEKEKLERINAEFSDSLDVREAAARAFAKRQAAIAAEADAEVADIEKKRAKAEPKTAQQRLEAEGGTLKTLAQARDVANDPMQAASGIEGPVGTVAAVAAVVRGAPAILRSAGDFLRDGLSAFLGDLGDGLKSFLLGLQDFPAQAARIFGEQLPKFIEEAIAAIPALIAGIDPITLSTKIAIAFVEAIPNIVRGFARGFERAAASIGRALTSDLARGILGAFKAAGGAIGGAVLRIIAPLIEAVRRVIRAVSRPGDSLADAANALAGGADSTGGRIAAGLATGGLSEVGRGIRSIFHTGGTVRGPGNPLAAASLALSGAPAFAFGGMVPEPGSGARAALRQALRGDDVPAILQSGEGVLSRRGMDAVGGEPALAALNRGQEVGGVGALEVVIAARPGAESALMRSVVGTVSAAVRSPTSPVRRALDQTRTPGPPLMSSYVRRP